MRFATLATLATRFPVNGYARVEVYTSKASQVSQVSQLWWALAAAPLANRTPPRFSLAEFAAIREPDRGNLGAIRY